LDAKLIPDRLFRLATAFYAAIAALRGVLRTRDRTTRRTRHSSREHVLVHVPVALGVAADLLAQTLRRLPEADVQVLAAVGALVTAAFGILLEIGTLCSFAASFMTFLLAFVPQKIS
jgi:hypothetical protein